MNPLKVTWFHMRARVRLFHIWLVVQLGLHRKAPTRLRSKLVKVAGWLEAAVINATAEASVEDTTRHAITETSNKLQSDMARLQQSDHQRSLNKEDIDCIKDSFLHLLDLCGIKDADIPPLTERVPLRHTQQTLITSFGIMSKSLSTSSSAAASNMTTPPQRNRRHVRRDPASYADMLIEQLMANASPDSDTSPPSAEESKMSINNNDPTTTTPSSSNTLSNQQQQQIPPTQPLTLRFDNDLHPTSSSHQPPHHLLSPASDARCGAWVEDNLSLPHPSHHHHHLIGARPTSDSGFTASGSSHTIASSANTMSPPMQFSDTLTTSKSTLQNTTSGSTPELPAVVNAATSQESLDIPFASFFGKLDNINSNKNTINLPSKTNILPSSNSETEAASSHQSCYNFPLKYSHSYARELQRLETEMFSDLQLEPDYIPSPKSIPRPSTDKSSSKDGHYDFHEPLVVVLPEKGLSKDKSDNYNNNNYYKPCLEDKSGVVESEQDSPKPPLPPRVPIVSSKTADKQNRLGQFFLATEPTKDLGNVWLSSQKPTNSPSSDDSPCNMSWSYVDSPPHQAPANSIVSSMSTGRAHIHEKKKNQGTHTRRPSSPFRPSAQTPTSASKRRKANDKSPMPVEHSAAPSQRPFKSVRQRLFLSPARRTNSPLRPSIGVTSLGDPSTPISIANSPRMERMKRSKRHSPAMRRLMQEKENNLLSPSKTQTSPRKPFGNLYNIKLNESDPLTTSSNSLSPSSENYAKSSETSPELPIPSREEDLLDRHAYYEDFTVDRDHKLDRLTPQQKKGLLRNSTRENFYTLRDPSSDEILVRQVEGAESSPGTRPSVFQAPLPNTRAPRSVRARNQTTSRQQLHPRSTSSSGSRGSSPTSGVSNKYNQRKARESKRRVSSASRASSASSSCHSHPMASSTLIMEPSVLSPEKDEETGSVYTWSIEEGSETCNLERSFLRSQSERKNKKNNNNNIPRQPTDVGRDSSDISDFEEMIDDKSSFEISSMVSAIGKSLEHTSVLSAGQQVESFCDDTMATPVNSKASVYNSLPRTSTRSTISGRGIVSAAPNLRNRISKPSSSNSNHSDGTSSESAAFNRAKGSIQSIPSSSDDQNEASASNSKNHAYTNLLKSVSMSAPDLARHHHHHHYPHHEDIDASHSLEPSDTDSTPEVASSIFHHERSDIPGKSCNSSSESSSCTAARCRPRVPPQTSEYSKVSADATPTQHQQQPQQSTSTAAQDLMDSILTDSPKSVDSSGIFAPYNSYNSPAESVGSHNGYSSTVSSSLPSSDSYYPPITVRLVQGHQGGAHPPNAMFPFPALAPPQSATNEDSVFKRPFSPAPFDRVARSPATRSQGVMTATASSSSTPTRPTSVRSEPLACGKSPLFAVPPGVVTGPPKISNKKSLVKKLKKFSTNFYKKGEKIQTLTYL